MNKLGKKNDIINYKYIMAIILAIAVISVFHVIKNKQISKDYSEFIKKCTFNKIDIYYYKHEKKIDTTITDKRIICDLWKLIKNAKSPSNLQKKLYDYSLEAYFYKGDNKPVMVYLDKDKGSNQVQIAFYGQRSTFSMEGIDENGLVEKIVKLIIKNN